MKKPRGHGLALNPTHGTGVAVGQNGFWILGRNGCQFGRNVLNGLVPSNLHKLASAFRSDALQGMHQAIGAVRALGVPRDFGAQHALGVLVVWVAKHLDGTPVLDCGQQSTGVRAIVWAQTAHHGIFFKD